MLHFLKIISKHCFVIWYVLIWFCLLSHFWLPQVLKPSIPPLMVINMCGLAWEKRRIVPQFLVFSGGGTVPSSGAAALGAAGCSGGEDLWQGVYLGAASVGEVSPLLHWPLKGMNQWKKIQIRFTTAILDSLGSPFEKVLYLQKQPLLAFSCFTVIIFFSVSQKCRIFPWNKNYF